MAALAAEPAVAVAPVDVILATTPPRATPLIRTVESVASCVGLPGARPFAHAKAPIAAARVPAEGDCPTIGPKSMHGGFPMDSPMA